MAEETFVLIMLVIVMLVGSYLAGSIPLVMKLSEEKLTFVTVLGAGLLVGTALTVIIPEGIRSLYMDDAGTAIAQQSMEQTTAAIIAPGDSRPTSIHFDHSRTIGLSLVLGFVFMMLVDQVSQQRQRKSSSRSATHSDKNFTATLGLVVHAAADGVALGAAATTSHQDVEIIVFLAIMLHKAPAAFGLVSFLLHEKIERQQIRRNLAIFSLSAPLLTLLTYFGIGQEQKETLNSVNATGIAMLFSAGTFLYVATVHVLPELTQNNCGHQNSLSGHRQSHSQYQYHALEEGSNNKDTSSASIITPATAVTVPKKGLSCCELTILICGALLPLVITIGHQH